MVWGEAPARASEPQHSVFGGARESGGWSSFLVTLHPEGKGETPGTRPPAWAQQCA